MEEISLPSKIEVKKEKDNQAIIVIEPCYPGYGTTIGNALRRVLLSSLSGAAVTSVKIKGVEHEFSTIPHIKEDVMEIVLNLKSLRLKLYTLDVARLHLFSKGKKKILAKDFKVPSQCKIVNSGLLIATATHKDAVLDMEIEASQGRGYVPVEQREEEVEVGKILVDSIFTPVLKVGYQVENVRVGKRTDFDKLILDITTDGSITPTEALARASKLLIDQFSFVFSSTKPKEVPREKPEIKVEKEIPEATPIKELKLSTRAFNALTKASITKAGDIIKLKKKELLTLEGFGKTALREVEKELKKLGLEIKAE